MALKGSTGTPTNIWKSNNYYKNKAKSNRKKKRREEKMFRKRHAKLDPIMMAAKSGCEESKKLLEDKYGIKIIMP